MTSVQRRVENDPENVVSIAADREKIVALLTEYSSKLKSSCEALEGKTQTRILWNAACTALISTLYIAFFIAFFVSIFSANIFGVNYLKVLIGLALGLAFLIYLLSLLNVFFEAKVSKEKINLMEINSKSLVYRLEKLVAFASQFHERIEMDPVNKMELDLKLDDAEAALRFYKTVTRKRKIQPFWN